MRERERQQFFSPAPLAVVQEPTNIRPWGAVLFLVEMPQSTYPMEIRLLPSQGYCSLRLYYCNAQQRQKRQFSRLSTALFRQK